MSWIDGWNGSSKIRFVLIALMLVLFLGWLIPGLGQALVVNDQLEKSDAIVVLMGGGYERMLETIDLYHAGYAPQIIMVQNSTNGYDVLLSRGIVALRDPDVLQMIGSQLGIPAQAFIVLPGDALSTQDEAVAVRAYLNQNPDLKALIIVTSKFHSGRAKRIFQKAVGSLDREVQIQADGSKYDELYQESWWQDREAMKTILLEYVKLANFYLREQFQL